MSWDEWEQLKASAAAGQSPHMQINSKYVNGGRIGAASDACAVSSRMLPSADVGAGEEMGALSGVAVRGPGPTEPPAADSPAHAPGRQWLTSPCPGT
jgi:hypothetical protein